MSLKLKKIEILLYLVVISLLDVPKIAIEVFALPIDYYLGGNPPWLMPLLLIFLIHNIFKSAGKVVVKIEDVLMLLTLFIWSLLYIYHDDFIGGGWNIWRGANLITTNLWMFLGYYLLKTYLYYDDVYENLIDVTIKAVSFIAFIIGVLILIDYFYKLPIHKELQSKNTLALILLFGSLLLLFFNKTYSIFSKFILIVLFNILIFYWNSRGAIIISILLISYKFYSCLKPQGIGRILTIILGIGTLSIAFLQFNFSELLDNLTGGLNLSAGYYSHAEGYGLKSEIVSTYSRLRTNILLIETFLENPLLGVGYVNVKNIQSFGYISHTYYLFPLTSYGILGSISYMMFFSYFFVKGVKWNTVATIATLIFIICMFSILNDMIAWLAILLIAINPNKKNK